MDLGVTFAGKLPTKIVLVSRSRCSINDLLASSSSASSSLADSGVVSGFLVAFLVSFLGLLCFDVLAVVGSVAVAFLLVVFVEGFSSGTAGGCSSALRLRFVVSLVAGAALAGTSEAGFFFDFLLAAAAVVLAPG